MQKILFFLRFFQDFKTLADVVIQETIRHDVGKLFPAIKDSIKGEESNKFENALGERVFVEISDDENQTKEILLKVLDGNDEAASNLTLEIYKNVITNESQNLPEAQLDVDLDIGIWIDPIDGTAEYIYGNNQPTNFPNIQKSGLKCATVLIGAYLKSSGEPFLGVINQPFASETTGSKIFYGISLNDFQLSNVPQCMERKNDEKIAILSSSESVDVKSFQKVFSAGAGK